MAGAQRHRGPEGDGFFLANVGGESEIALGFNRLSIIDTSALAAQPMRSEDGRHVLVYNGAVYNWKELARELGPGDLAPERGCGDTAVVFAALRRWGPAALPRFNGMWAILFYDAWEKTLLVSRDRLGIKPLYYHVADGDLFFASELKAILAARPRGFTVNPAAAIPFLSRGLVDSSEESMFVGIRSFPIASYAILDVRKPTESFRTERFWRHPVERGELPTAGAVSVAEVGERFSEAVRSCLRSDVPVGLLLSGGLDSSAIAGAAAEAGTRLTAFSMVWKPADSSEERFIDAVSRRHQLTVVKIDVSDDPLDLLDRLPEATWLNDGPIAGIEEVARLPLMEAARSRGFKVMLCGQGGDEQLGGYRKFFYFYLRELISRGRLLEAARLFAQVGHRTNALREFRISEALRYVSSSWLSRHSFISDAHQNRDSEDIGYGGSYARREWADLSRLSLPTLLHSEDRMSMGRSVEMRVPFLDHRLVECLARVHPSEKFQGGWTKGIFREAVAHLLPPEVRFRRDKNGFVWPVDEWVRGAFRERLNRLFADQLLADDIGLIDRSALQASFRQFLAGKGYLNGRHFLRVHAFETFLRRFEPHMAFSSAAMPSIPLLRTVRQVQPRPHDAERPARNAG